MTAAAPPRSIMTFMTEALIVSAVRTPVGRAGGALANVRADDLAAVAVRGAVDRVSFDPGRLDDVILGCTNQAGEDNRNVARMAALLAGFPVDVPGQTVNRLCGSGLQAIASAAQDNKAGGGAERGAAPQGRRRRSVRRGGRREHDARAVRDPQVRRSVEPSAAAGRGLNGRL